MDKTTNSIINENENGNNAEAKVKNILGSKELFDKFCDEVKFNYGAPAEWEADEAFLDMAQQLNLWENDDTVKLAREIAAVIPVEFMHSNQYSVEAFHEYNKVISEFPSWEKYGSPESLMHYAQTVVDKYELDYANKIEDSKLKREDVKSDKKYTSLSDIKAIDKQIKADEHKSVPEKAKEKGQEI